MRRLLIALLASTFLVASPVAARAEPITLAIASAVGLGSFFTAGAIATSIATFALTTAAAAALSLISNALKPKTPETAGPASGTSLNVQYGGNVPREVIFGTQVTGGHLIYANVCGDSTNNILQCVFVLSDGQCDGINRMWVNGELVTLVSEGGVLVADELRNGVGIALFRVKFFEGSYDQLAHDELVNDSNPPGRWTSNHRGRGVCYISVRQYYDEEHQLTGVPSVVVELRGNKLYDPRLDSTNGGSGSHRFGTPSTYEYSGNPSIIEYNFRRGVRVNTQVMVGMDTVAGGDLITTMYVSAANDCDDAIPLLGGGTEPRYRCGMAASADKQHSTTLDAIRQSMAGFTLERAGQFGPIAGVAQSSVFEFSDSDFLVGARATFSKYETRSNIATAIFGSFSDPAQKWAAVPFPTRELTSDDTLMGERLAKNLDLTQISSNAQAQRVAEIERRRSMMQQHGSQTLGADFIGIQPGDWGTYHSPYGDITIQVGSLSLAADDSVTFAWRAIASSVFSWTTAGELDPPAVPTGGEPAVRITAVASFAAGPTQVVADSGLTLPALQCTWTPILDPTISRIDIEYRVAAVPATVLTFQVDAPFAGVCVISGSVQALTAYELRARPIALPERTTTWTSWIAATSGSDQIVKGSLSAASATFASALHQLVSQVQGSGLAALRDDMDTLAAAIANVRTRTYANVVEVKDVIAAREGALSASIEEVRTVSVDAVTQTAFAQYQLDVVATYGDLTHNVGHEARIRTNEFALTDPSGSLATLTTELTATFGSISGGVYSAGVKFTAGALAKSDGTVIANAGVQLNAGGKITGYQIYASGSSSNFDIETDNFRIGKSGVTGGTFIPIFTVGTVGGTAQVAIAGSLLVDGAVITRTITTGSVTTPKVEDFAITQRAVSVLGSPATTTSSSYSTILTTSLTVTAPAGAAIDLIITGRITWGTNNILDSGWKVRLNPSTSFLDGYEVTASNQTRRDAICFVYPYTSSGSDSFTFDLQHASSGSTLTSERAVLIVEAFKK